MAHRMAARVLVCAVALAWAAAAGAQTWTPEQQEIWKLEQQQWQMSRDKDLTWIEKMVHPNMTYWETGAPVPQNTSSLTRWNRFTNASTNVLEQEIYPISCTITGNVAVAQYSYQVARENYKKERETLWGHYTDVLIKEGGKWLFIAWAGGDEPKKP